jgi:hypothetical protein
MLKSDDFCRAVRPVLQAFLALAFCLPNTRLGRNADETFKALGLSKPPPKSSMTRSPNAIMTRRKAPGGLAVEILPIRSRNISIRTISMPLQTIDTDAQRAHASNVISKDARLDA